MKHLYNFFFLLIFSFCSNAQLIITAEAPGATELRIGGPWWGEWNPGAGPTSIANGDGTFTFTFDPAPTATMEFKLIADGSYEDILTDYQAGNCGSNTNNINTDGASWANRLWHTTDGNMSITFGNCSSLTLSTIYNTFENLSVYPNPVVDEVNISAATSIDQVRVFDLVGRMVKQATPSSSNFSLDVADLSKGVYMVQLKAGDKEATTKLIK